MLITDSDIYHSEQLVELLENNKKELGFRKVTLPKGVTILNQGEVVSEVLFISQGVISLARISESGHCYQLGSYRHNGFLGLMELFSDKPCFYSVVAEVECQVYIVNGQAFHHLVCNHPILAAYTFKHLTSKWYLSIERMMRNLLNSITYCVANDLLDFARQSPKQAYVINKSVEAGRLGTSLRVYNRILKKLTERGAIRVHRQYIEILEQMILEKVMAEEADK